MYRNQPRLDTPEFTGRRRGHRPFPSPARIRTSSSRSATWVFSVNKRYDDHEMAVGTTPVSEQPSITLMDETMRSNGPEAHALSASKSVRWLLPMTSWSSTLPDELGETHSLLSTHQLLSKTEWSIGRLKMNARPSESARDKQSGFGIQRCGRYSRFLALFALSAAATLCLTNCGGDSSHLPQPAVQGTSRLLTPAGGDLTFPLNNGDTLTLSFPPGSINQTTTVSVTPLPQSALPAPVPSASRIPAASKGSAVVTATRQSGQGTYV